ncbi:Surp module (SWAP) [Glarea lozoyensis ATCC 20868]|uniref:Surp module (SWAP) n=1 Tax=Glarea lozoyensis (strain ATCC 20868 / MF5171) TaxID=1116229 RepID=S3DAG2_GLAL2|nr:Surp module (SWAP) [Glarea lozoyensis ATCC 20868]EPE28961.1 Surp module (SWAP) [Glarea lozoyensis ATCC 20868]
MPSDAEKKFGEFSEVEGKLQAPTKKSVFERQKADAEAKRLREEAETKAVYEDFVKSFDDEDDDIRGAFGRVDGGGRLGRGGFGAVSGPPKRHYGQGGLGAGAPSGPVAGRGFGSGGLGGRGAGSGPGSGPGSLGPPPSSVNKKRPFDGGLSQSSNRRDRDDRGVLAFEDYDQDKERGPAKAFHNSDDEDERTGSHSREEERAVPKPTLRLASLPPGTSPAVIKALMPATLTIDAVRILPATGPGTQSERKTMSAIVTLAKDTAANDIEAAVNLLQNKYLGFGHYLSLHRHLSSAVANIASLPSLGANTTSQPFGAKQVVIAPAGRGHAPPPTHQRGFAPPSSYGPSGPALNRNGPLLHVPVQPPQDIKELKLIHKVIECLLSHGPEFEALLMSRPDVQREEKWAWIWDSRSTGGVWYRWRLWEVLTGSITKRGQGRYLPLFEDSSAWKAPDQPLAYEYTTKLDEFVSDSEYNSSDDDESGDEGAKRQHHSGGAPPDPSLLTDDGKAYLNPLEKAKLTHLLSRLPTSTGQLRKGDVARITAFAISHAGKGSDEIVSMIVSNIEKPFSCTSANPEYKKEKETGGDDQPAAEDEEKSDTSSASLIGVYLISDILSSSSTSGVRHAWRYRQLFESALRQRKVFEGLGRMEKKMNWGRLRAEKWKRSVANILSLWEGWCVFPQGSQEHFVTVFNNPPLDAKDEAETKRKEEEEMAAKSRNRWKAVEVAATDTPPADSEEDVDGEPMEEDDVDGEPMADSDEDVDGVPMEEDIDGEPTEDDVDGEPMVEDQPAAPPETKETEPPKAEVEGQRRRRPRAVDMFADSDDSN